MSNETNETIEDIVADIRAQNQGLQEDSYALSPLVCDLLSLADRIIDAHKREMEDEKRISDAVVQSLRDKKLEMAGEIAEKEAEVESLRALVKDLADIVDAPLCHQDCSKCPTDTRCASKRLRALVAKAREVVK